MSGAPPVTWRVYGAIALMLAVSAGVGYASSAGFGVRLLVGVTIGISTLLLSRSVLRLEEAFPELTRIALVRRLLK